MSNATRTTVIVAAVLLLNLSVQGAEKIFSPSKDTWITSEKMDKPGCRAHRNYGAGKFLAADTRDTFKSHILLQFDLKDAIPENAELVSAKLVMGERLKPGIGTLEAVEIRRLLKDDWEQGEQGDTTHIARRGASWMARSYPDEAEELSWEKPGALGAADGDVQNLLLFTQARFQEFESDGVDVLSLLKAWQEDRGSQFSMMIRTTNDKIHLLRWNSTRAGDDKGPKLLVSWK